MCDYDPSMVVDEYFRLMEDVVEGERRHGYRDEPIIEIEPETETPYEKMSNLWAALCELYIDIAMIDDVVAAAIGDGILYVDEAKELDAWFDYIPF